MIRVKYDTLYLTNDRDPSELMFGRWRISHIMKIAKDYYLCESEEAVYTTNELCTFMIQLSPNSLSIYIIQKWSKLNRVSCIKREATIINVINILREITWNPCMWNFTLELEFQ